MTKKKSRRRRARQGPAAALQFIPWVAAALLLVALLWQSDSAAVSGLFQSPPTVTPTRAATDTPEPTATQPPTSAPTATDVVPPTAPPTQPLPATATPTLQPTMPATPTLTVSTTPAITTTPTITGTPTITATEGIDAGEGGTGTGPEGSRYPDEDSNVEFEWSMLFDSVALALSYGWLCCGAALMLLLPVSFLALWVASRRRRQRME